MKLRLWSLLLAAILLTASASLADTALDGKSDRSIVPVENAGNLVEEGVSPTTGRSLAGLQLPDGFSGLAADGRYQPMLVQIDNTDNGVGYRAPWGGIWSDIIYESALRREGHTRITMLFSDAIPYNVGPVRSARIGHVWLREEWGAGFVYYGQQEYYRTNVKEELDRLGATRDGVAFSGTAKTWSDYFYSRPKLASPHDKGADVAGLQSLIPADYAVPNHAFRFTDEPAVGDSATVITVNWGRKDYQSQYTWSAALGRYTRMVGSGKQQEVYHDLDTGEAITFANVIVQWTDMDWPQVTAPVMRITGDAAFFSDWADGSFTAQGNADFFMNGVHVSGYWRRSGMDDRTVYYGPDGEEIELQRGRTMVILFPCVERQVHEGAGHKTEIISVDRSVTYR